MVDIIPFRGFRPRADLASRVASPPYDVVDSDEARKLAEGNEYSFLHIVKPEIDLAVDVDPYDDSVYAKGAENLRKFVQDGVLFQDPSACFYVYRQKMGDHVQTGLVAGASVRDYQENRIKKHEHTRPDKEADRTRHIDTLGANTGPVFLTYHQSTDVDALIDKICAGKPEYDFTADDGIQHTFWVAIDNVAAIREAFRQIPALYVADGHHRSAAGTKVCEKRQAKNPLHTGEEAYNYFLAVIFPDNQMKILPYNRVVIDIPLDEQSFLDKVGENFTLVETEEAAPSQPHQFGMYWCGKWYRLTAKGTIVAEDDPVRRLDVFILQKYLFHSVLGIENPRTDKRLHFVGGIKSSGYLEQCVAKQQKAAAFVLYPVSVADLIAVSDAGEVMPPKSTWFEPKLRSGLIVRPLV